MFRIYPVESRRVGGVNAPVGSRDIVHNNPVTSEQKLDTTRGATCL